MSLIQPVFEPLDEQIRKLTDGGKLIAEYQVKILKRGIDSTSFDPALVQAAQRAADWLTQRGWGKPPDADKDEGKTSSAAAPLTTEQLLAIANATAGKKK